MSNSSRFVVAAHMLINLAIRSGERLSPNRLTWGVNANPTVIRQSLCSLRETDLVDSKHGPTDDFTLAHKLGAITLRDIYEVMEDVKPFCFHTNELNDKCIVGEYIRPVLGELPGPAIQAVFDELGPVTVADAHAKIVETADGNPLEAQHSVERGSGRRLHRLTLDRPLTLDVKPLDGPFLYLIEHRAQRGALVDQRVVRCHWCVLFHLVVSEVVFPQVVEDTRERP